MYPQNAKTPPKHSILESTVKCLHSMLTALHHPSRKLATRSKRGRHLPLLVLNQYSLLSCHECNYNVQEMWQCSLLVCNSKLLYNSFLLQHFNFWFYPFFQFCFLSNYPLPIPLPLKFPPPFLPQFLNFSLHYPTPHPIDKCISTSDKRIEFILQTVIC